MYQVQYSGIVVNVNNSTTTLMFTAPSLPDDVSTGTVVVMVSAINRYGIGPASAATTEIRGNTLHLYVRIYTICNILTNVMIGIMIIIHTYVRTYVRMYGQV